MRSRTTPVLAVATAAVIGLQGLCSGQEFRINAVTASPSETRLTWANVTNRYILEKADSLTNAFEFAGDVLPNSSATIPRPDGSCFYRVRKVRVVRFADSTLESRVASAIPQKRAPVDEVYGFETDSLLNLDVSNSGITSMSGLEEFTGLTALRCEDNNITSLDLSLFEALRNLNCANNSIGSLILPAGTELQTMDFSGNSMTGILNVASCSSLTNVNVTGTPLAQIQIGKHPGQGLDVTRSAGTKLITYVSGVVGVATSSSMLNVTLHDDFGLTYDQMIHLAATEYMSVSFLTTIFRSTDFPKPSGMASGYFILSHDGVVYKVSSGLGRYANAPGIPIQAELEVTGAVGANGVVPARAVQSCSPHDLVPGSIFMQFENGISPEDASAFLKQFDLVLSRSWANPVYGTVAVPFGEELKWSYALRSFPNVRYAEPNAILYPL